MIKTNNYKPLSILNRKQILETLKRKLKTISCEMKLSYIDNKKMSTKLEITINLNLK